MPNWLRRFLGMSLTPALVDVEATQLAARVLLAEQEKVKASAHAHVAAERRRTDTRRRAITAEAEKMATVFLPTNGKSIEERAADERDEATTS